MSERDREARQRKRDLAHLRYHWGAPYEIGWAAGMFFFRRRDSMARTQCPTAPELLQDIRKDYNARPVARDAWASGNGTPRPD